MKSAISDIIKFITAPEEHKKPSAASGRRCLFKTRHDEINFAGPHNMLQVLALPRLYGRPSGLFEKHFPVLLASGDVEVSGAQGGGISRGSGNLSLTSYKISEKQKRPLPELL